MVMNEAIAKSMLEALEDAFKERTDEMQREINGLRADVGRLARGENVVRDCKGQFRKERLHNCFINLCDLRIDLVNLQNKLNEDMLVTDEHKNITRDARAELSMIIDKLVLEVY